MSSKKWSLGAKLALVVTPFLLVVLFSTVATLWVSWQLDGGAAAINEAGRMRMQSYRMALSVSLGQTKELSQQIEQFEQSLSVLRTGDPDRPLFIPWDKVVRDRFEAVAQHWSGFRDDWLRGGQTRLDALRLETGAFVADIDALVISIESHMSLWTSLLYLLQMSVMGMSILVAAILIYAGYVFVLEPVSQLEQAVEKIQQGDFDSRVVHVTSDEFGILATGFNGMADNLQSMYRNLEHKVAEKTSELEEKTERLESLYEVTTLVTNSTALDELAQGFARSIVRIARADGATVRWSDRGNRHFLMLAAHGMPQSLVDAEQCIDQGSCHCGGTIADSGLRVVQIHAVAQRAQLLCARAGFKSMLNIPIRLHERLMGEVDLFFNAIVSPTPALRSLLEALGSHLAGAMENLRLNGLEKEAAVAQERLYLASELHDSIAQSLAFLKIQVQLMRDAVQSGNPDEIRGVLDEIDAGVRESYGNVRELLLHFRTRANDEEIEPALSTTLRKFEHQSGVKASLSVRGRGIPLPQDVQIQVLHIVQEALSNVRKHAQASHVKLDIEQQPAWRFEVSDDGIGFNVDSDPLDETHVGLRIMRERARSIGADLVVDSSPGHGCSVRLALPQPSHPVSPETAHSNEVLA